MAEFDGAFHLFGRNVRSGRFGRLFLLFEKLKDAACGGGGGLEEIGCLPELRQGRLEEVDVDEEGGEIAERRCALRHQDTPHHADGDVAEFGEEGRQRMSDRRNDIGAVHGGAERFVAAFKGGCRAFLGTIGTDELERGIALLRLPVEGPQPLLLRTEILL